MNINRIWLQPILSRICFLVFLTKKGGKRLPVLWNQSRSWSLVIVLVVLIFETWTVEAALGSIRSAGLVHVDF